MAFLELTNVEVRYSGAILVLKGLSLRVARGQIVALLGPNGAGKSTTLKAISGLLAAEEGTITRGQILFDGSPLDGRSAAEIVRSGIFQVMEGRRIFDELSVEKNLWMGAFSRSDRSALQADYARVFRYFPALEPLRERRAGYLSGGEQQMLAIGRGLMARPRLLLLDEPSLGLSPLLTRQIFEIIRQINREEGVTVLLVEQDASRALELADHGYVMEGGKIVLDGTAGELRDDRNIREFYLSGPDVGRRRRYTELKFYKRRKRWFSS
jgi:branched-chain amino acid transport system ATP-binding protein